MIYDRALSDTDITFLANKPHYEYHHLNALGSPIVLTDSDKAVIARYDYDVFGAIRSETGTSGNVRKFTGKEWDADSNLYYFAARYYDPYIGRFTQRDPIGDGVNWYAYTHNNPLKFVDPTGMRALFASERRLSRVIFGRSVNLNRVTVRGGLVGKLVSANAGARAWGNTIYIKKPTGLRVMMHEMTHVWQWQNKFKPAVALFGLVEGTAAIVDHDGVYDRDASYLGIESQAVRVEEITRDYLLKSMSSLKAADIIEFVQDELPFLLDLQQNGADSDLIMMLNRVDIPDLMSGLISQLGTNQTFWQVLERLSKPDYSHLQSLTR